MENQLTQYMPAPAEPTLEMLLLASVLATSIARPRHAKIHVTRTQRDVLRDVMLSASECGAWYTLEELHRVTQFAEASISAQLRSLRKAENGGYTLRRRKRMSRHVQGIVSWESEYQIAKIDKKNLP